MELIDNILKYKSLSIVGIEKNTGKTETLNFVLNSLKGQGKKVAITSIGIDGENTDAVTQTPKPEITVYEGMIFTTAEQFFLQKRFKAEILDISRQHTILGKLVTAKALRSGKIMLTGAADTHSLKKIIENHRKFSVDITIVDGALSRLSLASPAVTEAMILATGAAYSSNIETLVKKTKFICSLINLNKFQANIHFNNSDMKEERRLDYDTDIKGIYCLLGNKLHNLEVTSALTISNISKDNLEKLRKSKVIFVFGILSNRLIDFLMGKNITKDVTIVAKDFSAIFISDFQYNMFIRAGGEFMVMKKSNLLALTINPTSPQGIVLNSEILQKRLEEVIDVPVIDVRRV